MFFLRVFHSIICLRSGKVIGYECQLEFVGVSPMSGLLSIHMVTALGCPELRLCWVFSVQLEEVRAKEVKDQI